LALRLSPEALASRAFALSRFLSVGWLQNYNGAVVAAATVALLLITRIYVLLTGRMLRAAQRQATLREYKFKTRAPLRSWRS
jgi:hypothetical protein